MNSNSKRRYTPSTKGKIIASLLIVLCVGIIGYVAREFRADLLYWEAHYMQKHWTETGGYPPLDELQEAKQLYQTALKWVPGYPAYHDSLAYLLRLEMSLTPDPAEYERLGHESIRNNQIALENRPIWPSSYSQMAIVKSLLGEFDQDWLDYYQTAFEMGPWEEVNLVQITEAGMMRWPYLVESQQQIAITSLLRALQYNRDHSIYIRQVMDTYARTEIICAILLESNATLPETGQTLPRNLCN